jgi:hypothetical protein
MDSAGMDDTLYPVIALPSHSGDCSDAISAIASLDSSWIYQRMKLVQHQNNDRLQHRRKSKTSLEEKRLECIENFIVTVVKGKLRTGEACWPKTELKLLMSSQPTPDEKAEECRAIVPYTQHRKTTGGQSRRASTGSRHCNRGTTSNSRLATSLNPISEKKKDDLGETNHSLESSTKVDALDEEDDDNGRPTKNKYLFPPFHSEVRANMPTNNFIHRESHDNTSAMSGLSMPSALLSSDDHQPMAGWVIQEKQQHYTGEPRGGIARRATMPELSHQAAPRLKTNCRDPSDDKDDIMLPMPPALSIPIPPIMITRAGSTDPPPSTDNNNNKNNNNIASTSSPSQPRRTPPQTRRTPPPPSQGEGMLPLPSNKAFPPPPFNPKEPYLARSRSNSNNKNGTTPAADSKEPVSSSKQQSQIFVVPGLPPVARPKSLMVVAEELHIKASSKDVGVGTGGGMTTKQLFDNKRMSSSKSSALRGRGGDPPSSHEYHRKRERVNQTTRKKTSRTTATARINNHHLSSSNRVVVNIGSGNKTSGGGGGDLNPKKKQPSSNTKVATATTNTASEATTSAAVALDNNKKVFVSHWGWRKQTIHRRASTGSTNVATSSTRGNTRGSM